MGDRMSYFSQSLFSALDLSHLLMSVSKVSDNECRSRVPTPDPQLRIRERPSDEMPSPPSTTTPNSLAMYVCSCLLLAIRGVMQVLTPAVLCCWDALSAGRRPQVSSLDVRLAHDDARCIGCTHSGLPLPSSASDQNRRTLDDQRHLFQRWEMAEASRSCFFRYLTGTRRATCFPIPIRYRPSRSGHLGGVGLRRN